MAFSGVTDGTVRIRPLSESTADVANLARWLSDPRVLEFYEGRDKGEGPPTGVGRPFRFL